MNRRLLGLLVLLALTGCVESSAPWGPAPVASTSPGNSTPELTIRSVAWSWNHQSVEAYRSLFTDDYRFSFSTLDPAGDAYRGDTWIREDEMIFAQHLFVGGSPTEPAATSIQLAFNSKLVVEPDPRPGKDPRRYKYVRTALSLVVIDPDKMTDVTGFTNFYLVRGDSAEVPLGSVRDSTRWYIDRWEDDTANNGGAPAQAMPTRNPTLGRIKALYR